MDWNLESFIVPVLTNKFLEETALFGRSLSDFTDLFSLLAFSDILTLILLSFDVFLII